MALPPRCAAPLKPKTDTGSELEIMTGAARIGKRNQYRNTEWVSWVTDQRIEGAGPVMDYQITAVKTQHHSFLPGLQSRPS